jgi:AraC family transcriptional regulator
MEVEIRKMPAMRLACIAHKGAYNEIGKAFDRLQGWMKANDIVPELVLGAYYDDPSATPVDQLRSAACVRVADDFTSTDPSVTVEDMPANEYAVYRHLGAYQGLPAAWGQLMGWMQQSGRRHGAGPSLEAYLNDCRVVPEPELVTELMAPLAPA